MVKLDRMSMAHSLEGREPLLDTQLAEFIFSLPGNYKLRGFRGKYLLRKVLESRLPASILHRSKQGFSIPLGKWLRGPIRGAAEDLLLSAPPDFYQFFRREFVESLLRRHQQRKADLGRQIWNLMAVSTWLNEAQAARRIEEPVFAGAA
jgi:asparagine synthase (glutamine-hydrolysing)